MVSLNGFIKTHRKIMEWEWYKNQNVKDVFLHLCLKANFKENNFEGVQVRPGQLITSQPHLAEELGLSRQEVRTALKKLEKTGEITIEATNKFSLITIANWGKYQTQDFELTNNTTSEQPTANQQPTSEQPQLNNEKTVNTVEKEKNSQSDSSFSSGTINQPPTAEEVEEYCRQMGYNRVDARKLVDHYAGTEWKDAGGNPIRDWKASVKQWNGAERQQAPQKTQEPDPKQERKAVLKKILKDYIETGKPIPPVNLAEVKEYCAQWKEMNPEEFYNYFEGTGWMLFDKPVLDWKSAANLWARGIRESSKKLIPGEIAQIIYIGPGNFTIWDENEVWYNYDVGFLKMDHILKDAGKISSFGEPCPMGMTMEEFEKLYKQMTK